MADDEIRLVLDGKTLGRATKYEIVRDVFTQPCAFSFTVGDAVVASELLDASRPNLKFELYVNDTRIFTGRIDGLTCESDARRGTEVSVRGRDRMACLVGACVQGEQTFADITYLDLVTTALDAVTDEGFEIRRLRRSGLTYTHDVSYMMTSHTRRVR